MSRLKLLARGLLAQWLHGVPIAEAARCTTPMQQGCSYRCYRTGQTTRGYVASAADAWQPGIKDLSTVPNLAFLNDELAEARKKDRASARQHMFARVHQVLAERGQQGDAPISLEALDCLTGTEISRMLLSCVADPALADADSLDLRWRLLAVLQYTALRGSVAINLYDRADLDELSTEYVRAWHEGDTLRPEAIQAGNGAQGRRGAKMRAAETVRAAMERAVRARSAADEPPQLVTIEAVADLLVDARLEDIAIVDLTAVSGQRTADTLILASGRSAQHALAGARAVQFQIKEAIRVADGEELHRAVTMTGDIDGGWYSVDKWGLSVHCMTREHRAELQLEELWGERDNVRWWRQAERPLTLDNINIEP